MSEVTWAKLAALGDQMQAARGAAKQPRDVQLAMRAAICNRPASKDAMFARQYFAAMQSAIGGHVTAAHVASANAKIERSFWETFNQNTAEVILTREAVMMIDLMKGGIPKGWGEPRKTKGMYVWLSVSTPKTSEAFLERDLFKHLPADSYYVSWTNNQGTRREYIGNPDKFCMNPDAPVSNKNGEFRIFAEEATIGLEDWDL